jgi:pilus assembly protein FimV
MQQQNESVEQVMMALQRHNPDAFINNNVNNLKVGKVLRLPEGADVTSLSRAQARSEFMAQTQAWRSGKPVAAKAPAKTQDRAKDRLKLISPKPDASEAMAREGKADEAEIGRLQQEILLVRESNESALQENDALRNRVGELEKQIEDIQRLMTLKSDELAEMQAAQQIASEKMEEIQTAVPEEAAPQAEPEEEVVSAPAVEEAPVVAVPEGTVIEETNIEEVIAESQEEVEPAPVAEQPQVAQTTPEQPAVAEAPAKATPPVKFPEKKVSYFDGLGDNATKMGIIGGVAALLLGLLWMLMRRRKEAEAEFAESILVSPDSEVVAGKDDSDSLNEPTDETSFMSDFSPSDIDALQDETGEVDPLSEADVYIAYGRYQQAEELIKQAIEKFPEREELKHKLLEIYFSAKKGGEFTNLAETLQSEGLESRNPDAWSKIVSMGKELNPGHALFAAAAGAAGMALSGDDDEMEDLGLDLESALSEMEEEPAPQESLDSDEIDSMDLSGLDNLDEMDSESLEADLSLDSEFLDKMESGTVEEAGDALEIDLGGLDTESEMQSEVAALDEPQSEMQDSTGFEDSETLDNLDIESIEQELESLSEDLDSQAAEPLELPEADSHEISMDLDSTDEVTTKLDLARAYIDMGDNEGAKSILEEVASEGTDQQKEEAKELMNNIGA